tara:strand:+ start:58 stop:1263 length:1206 start_codon:yes stop_codon:yes gene_type:complete
MLKKTLSKHKKTSLRKHKHKNKKRRSRKKSKHNTKRKKTETPIKILFVTTIMTDKAIKEKEGEYIDFSYYTKHPKAFGLCSEDVDVYITEPNSSIPNGWRFGYKHEIKSTDQLLLKFRKNVISKKFTDKALKAFRKQSKVLHDNRGASGGLLDSNKLPNYVAKHVSPGRFRTKFIRKSDNQKSQTLTSNLAPSNIVGFYDKPDRNFVDSPPCRLTAFTRDHPSLWKDSLPFIKRCDRLFKKLIPKRYKKQKNKADKINTFRIDDTAFTTLTINYSWRTGCHKDSGDLDEGFGNLVVIEDDDNPHSYEGCYLGFPQYGVCVDVRQGDFLAMNVHEWHCNTEFIDLGGDTSNIKPNILKNKWYFNRLSLVLYLRKKMLRCKGLKTNKKTPSMSRLKLKQSRSK